MLFLLGIAIAYLCICFKKEKNIESILTVASDSSFGAALFNFTTVVPVTDTNGDDF